MAEKTYVIIDDDRDFLEELQDILNEDARIVVFSDAGLALASIPDLQPQVIITDLKMEGQSGFEVLNRLRVDPKTRKIPVIGMSAYYEVRQPSDMMKVYGLDDYIIKPFSPADLLSKIEIQMARDGEDNRKTND